MELSYIIVSEENEIEITKKIFKSCNISTSSEYNIV